jgi:hypothetical protein
MRAWENILICVSWQYPINWDCNIHKSAAVACLVDYDPLVFTTRNMKSCCITEEEKKIRA